MDKLFHKRFINVQSKLVAPKDEKNTFARFDYRKIEGILKNLKPLLKENELYLYIKDEIVTIGERYYVKATVTVTDGETTIEITPVCWK